MILYTANIPCAYGILRYNNIARHETNIYMSQSTYYITIACLQCCNIKQVIIVNNVIVNYIMIQLYLQGSCSATLYNLAVKF